MIEMNIVYNLKKAEMDSWSGQISQCIKSQPDRMFFSFSQNTAWQGSLLLIVKLSEEWTYPRWLTLLYPIGWHEIKWDLPGAELLHGYATFSTEWRNGKEKTLLAITEKVYLENIAD